MKSLEEVNKLKESWKKDPIWDIEDTEGFEEYREELLQFSRDCKYQWEERAKREHDRLAAKVCPMSIAFTTDGINAGHSHFNCLVETCAWWNDSLGVCGVIVGGYLAGIQVAREEARGVK